MQIVTRDPHNLFGQLRREMDQLLNQRLSAFSSAERRSSEEKNFESLRPQWIPVVDIHESEEKFTIHADLPGIDPKDIEISMERGVLRISGERSFQKEEQQSNYRRVERAYGRFARQFALPETANADAIKAEGKNGVLIITIPKQPKAQPKRIDVTVN